MTNTSLIDRANKIRRLSPEVSLLSDHNAEWVAGACHLIAEMATRIVVLEKLCRTGKGWPVSDE